MKLSFGYSDSEDRVWIRIEGSPAIWWLTRRIAIGLLRQWGAMIERSYADRDPAAPDAAAQARSAPARAGAAHVVAVAAAKPVDPVERAPTEPVNRIVSSIDLSMAPGRFTVVLKGGGGEDTLRMTRDEAHRMLAALHGRCRRSGWFDAALPAWLLQEPGARGSGS